MNPRTRNRQIAPNQAPRHQASAQRHALLIGHSLGLMLLIPQLLARAGFIVDVITTAPRANTLTPTRQIFRATDAHSLLRVAADQCQQSYDLIVMGDDQVLRETVQSDLPDEIKLKLLPVCSNDHFKHIGSKVGLSQVLEGAGVRTPDYAVAHDANELARILMTTQRPVFLKIDQSGGGAGVFPYFPGDDISGWVHRPFTYPVLVQERIEGDLIDLSGFYQGGELIHFSYSHMHAFISNPFGPSSLRTYTQLGMVSDTVFSQMRDLGHALGANGFVNITCIRKRSKTTDEDMNFFIEADMRPTTWADYSRYLGNDPAIAIRRYFEENRILRAPPHLNPNYPDTLIIPYVFRLSVLALLINRHGAWSYCKGFSGRDLMRHLISWPIQPIKRLASQLIKPRVSQSNWQRLKAAWAWLAGER